MTVMYKELTPTEDKTLTVSYSITGGSGTGKTYSLLRGARGLAGGEKFAVLDTENKRALHYQAEFPEMVHFNFGPIVDDEVIGFPPERWIAAIDSIEKQGFKALVIDSFSHAWEGINGVLEMHQQELERLVAEAEAKANGRYTVDPAKFSQLAWAAVKPRYRRLIERIVQAKMHIGIGIRAKPVMQTGYGDKQKNARPTKLRRDDLPWDIAADKDLIFEMTLAMLMVPERPGQPILLKCADQFRGMFADNAQFSEKIGAALKKWADNGGAVENAKALLDKARAKAREGRAPFKEWYATLPKAERATVQTIMGEITALADAATQALDDDPFAGSDSEVMPTEEEKAAAMKAAEAAARSQHNDAQGTPEGIA